jgi:hypothetical protein
VGPAAEAATDAQHDAIPDLATVHGIRSVPGGGTLPLMTRWG